MKLFYALGEFTSDVVESLGTGIYRMGYGIFKAAQNANSRNVIGTFFFFYHGLIFQCVALLISFWVKGAFSVVGDLLSSIWYLVLGLFRLNRAFMAKGALLPFHSLNGHLLVFSGYIVVVIQKLFFIQKFDRSFTDHESEILKDLFDDSIATYNIRLVEGRSGIFHVNGRPFVLGNFIFMKDVSKHRGLPVLIHECVHIWQYQRYGARYASEALYAQWTLQNAYDWRAEKKKDSNWFNWNWEAQAAFIEEMWGSVKRTYAQDQIVGNKGIRSFLRDHDDETSAEFLFAKEVIRELRSYSHNRLI